MSTLQDCHFDRREKSYGLGIMRNGLRFLASLKMTKEGAGGIRPASFEVYLFYVLHEDAKGSERSSAEQTRVIRQAHGDYVA